MPPPYEGEGEGGVKNFGPNTFLYIYRQACIPKIMSLELFWMEIWISPYILHKEKMLSPPLREVEGGGPKPFLYI